ncbi:WAT1-related protein [Rosa sericea]
MPKESVSRMLTQAKPFVAVILMQFGLAGMPIITKFALNQGMSQHVLVVYRHAVAFVFITPFALFFDRKIRPKMSLSVFVKIVLLGLLEPVIDGNLFYTGMKLTTATFTTAMCNVLPAFAFIMAWIFRLEMVDIRRLHSQAKILGTIVTVGGAMLMTLVNGPMLTLPWTRSSSHHQSTSSTDSQDPIKGALMITAGCFCWASFFILQAITLKVYPAELSLTAWICLMGALEGTVAALAFEWHNPAAWAIHLDSKLLAAVYGGVICSGLTYYIQGMVMKERGPVFVTAFNPLSMVIVAILSSIALSEILYLGRVMGAMVIIIGLYMVLWGKSKDPLPQPDSEAAEDKVATTV